MSLMGHRIVAIVYEVLKNDTAISALVELFNFCFDNSIIPSTWAKAVINPIPKSDSSDPRVPLNYRGISLLPIVSKLLTGLAGRVVDHLEAETNSPICRMASGQTDLAWIIYSHYMI